MSKLSKKAAKSMAISHTRMGNAPTKEDEYNLTDWLMDTPVYYDAAHEGLTYLAKLDGSHYMKIAVDISLANENHRGVRFLLPKIDTMYGLDLSTENNLGIDELNCIMKMQKIR